MSSTRKKTDKNSSMLKSRSLQSGLKIRNKRKLKSFDWTNETIEACANSEYVVPVEQQVENMETKIARVQERKKEAQERADRKAQSATPQTRSETALSRFSSLGFASGSVLEGLVSALNKHFEDYIEGYPGLITPVETKFPLKYYDSSKFDEILTMPSHAREAACLISIKTPDSSLRHQGLGIWFPCSNIFITSNGEYQVTLRHRSHAENIIVDRMQLCFLEDDLEIYGERITDALNRRHDCIALIKYNYTIGNMPFDTRVASTLEASQAERIAKKAMTMKMSGDISLNHVINAMVIETKDDYEFVMKKLIFDANMLNRTNFSVFESFQLPMSAFYKPTTVALCGSVTIPPHNMTQVIKYFRTTTYLSSKYALTALQGSVKENFNVTSLNMFPTTYMKSFTLEKFERAMFEALQGAVRTIKQDWPLHAANAIREAMLSDPERRYDCNIRNVRDFEMSTNPIKSFMERINFMMSDVLTEILHVQLLKYTSFFQQLCDFSVEVESIERIKVMMKSDAIYKTKALPPLFLISIGISEQLVVLNSEEVEEYQKELARWKRADAAADGGVFPGQVVDPIMGRVFIFNNAAEDFCDSVLKVFDTMLSELQDVSHVQKYVLDRIFWPVPRFVPTVTEQVEWVIEARNAVAAAMSSAIEPVKKYLSLFRKYDDFVNMNTQEYIRSRITVVRKDPESTEAEIPVSVNLTTITTVLEEHKAAIKEIESQIPLHPKECGLFQIDVSGVRHMLLGKHMEIMHTILSTHVMHCREIAQYLDDEFRKILKNLGKRPENIEQLTELEDYVRGVNVILAPLQIGIQDMMEFNRIHEKFNFKVDLEHTLFKWNVYGLPAKIYTKCAEVVDSNSHIKRTLLENMLEEQAAFSKTLVEVDTEVQSLESFIDIGEVIFVSDRVRNVEKKLQQAQEKARLFNSREALFAKDMTDYESLNKTIKNFEPYANLWLTAKEWTEAWEIWTKGTFIDLNAEDVEKRVDKFFSAINKAHKYFTKQNMEEQASIASLIRSQVLTFRPEVPLLVTLRNPGMRNRHWEQISKQLEVNLIPIEKFTTEQIIAMNLKDNLDIIQKISESAAKEYQIEQALDKMEKEWENMHLSIHPYRETGTGILKGVDDINVVLDEQITMTQTIMFSAFKGPFEARIEEWNRKLCCVSDVLEIWMIVQRNWLYLQPIFESPDINRQLPTEGKKFATVDKNWRGSVSSAKVNSKVIEYCDNEKLLERFKESEVLLDQVQKGLSDYLETKRSVFARFYFLSNDELLSILSESKDVKRVQPHLKKCFEGIDKVNFLDDLSIDRMISPEGEEVILLRKVNPVGKNVEHWMLELEGMMRTSVREVMRQAIEDYLLTPRPKWMQKWAGMAVLNGSQMHWTKEMEDLLVSDGFRGPGIMYERQVAQLADMTILVRGNLGKLARVTIGALTVIDVHARDVIKKLVDDLVDSKDNFGWTSQLRYYWNGDLTAQMVAASRSYGYEYLGNTFRLVITPLTDKCYLTLMGALQMIFGGAPAGPAGTGKTETTKDLAKALAMQCVVFNCSDGLDYIAM